jgi:hypothetical protein
LTRPNASGCRRKRARQLAKHALLIGISEFADKRLNRLNAPTNDVLALRGILRDKERGAFDTVELSINEDYMAVRDRLAKLYQDRAPDDLLLLYNSGHGILDRGRLFLATAGSDLDAPRARSIAAKDVREFMEECRAERQIVVLDCCHSGAFAEGVKAGGPVPAVVPDTFVGGDAGTYVLTASDAMQFAWDGSELRTGEADGISRFTAWLVEGLQGGEAAPDDEQISMDALYRYLYRRARAQGAPSTPQRFVHGGVGDPVISRNPTAGSAHLPAELKEKLSSPDYLVRIGVVMQLSQLIRGTDRAQARGARSALMQRMSEEYDVRVYRAMENALADPEIAKEEERKQRQREDQEREESRKKRELEEASRGGSEATRVRRTAARERPKAKRGPKAKRARKAGTRGTASAATATRRTGTPASGARTD